MKNSILSVLCAGIALAIGAANPAAAASVSGGHNLGGINAACGSSGPGSGYVDEGSTGCSEYIDSGSFQMSGSAQATYDSLRASASAGMSALDPSYNYGSGSIILSALGQAKSNDRLTIDIPGRTGEMVDLAFQTAMGGSLSVSADYTYVFGIADAILNVQVNGDRVAVSRRISNSPTTPPIFNDTNPGRVQIQLGTPFSVISELTVKAQLGLISGQYYTGDAASNFANTAGITSFTLFESGEGGALISDWDLASESGQFGFYTAVPAPATVWLLAPALGLLVPWVKRKAKA